MNISAKEHCGLLAMAELARRRDSRPVPLSVIACAQDISLDYLEQIVPRLRAAGLVSSTRGSKGGYRLSRAPSEITIGDVLRALVGDIFDLRCLRDKGLQPCRRNEVCVVHPVWEDVLSRVLETLDSTTLADLRSPDYRHLQTTASGHESSSEHRLKP